MSSSSIELYNRFCIFYALNECIIILSVILYTLTIEFVIMSN